MSERPTYKELERRIKELEKEATAHQQAEKEKENVLDGLMEHVVHEDREMRIVWANRAACESAGLRREELIGRYCYEIWPQRSDPCPDCPVIKSMESGLPHKVEKVTPDGRAWLINGYPTFDDKGQIQGGLETTLEITDKKRSEEILRIQNKIADIFLTRDDEEMYGEILGVVLDVMKSQFGIFGYIDEKGSIVCPSLTTDIWDQCQVVDKNFIFPENTWGNSIWGNAVRTKKSAYSNKPFTVPEGHIPIDRCLAVPIVYQDKSIGILEVANKPTDYTESDKQTLEVIAEHVSPVLYARLERKRSEDALRESEKRYRQLVQYAPAGITEIDIKKKRFISVNDVICEYTGYTREELFAMEPLDIFSEDSKALFLKRLAKAAAGEQIPEAAEYKIRKKDGQEIFVLSNVRVIFDEKATPVKTTAVSYNITDRKQAEIALQREQEKFRVLVEESPLGVSLIGENGRHKYLNPKFMDIFGYTLDDIPTEKDWFERAYPDQEYRNQVLSAWIRDQKEFKVGEVRPQTFNITCKDGSEKTVNLKPVTMKTGDQLVIYEDITDKRRLEAQFQQAQRMEAIGTLAGGIAHNFNNLLMVIQGRTSLMLLDKDSSHPDFNHLRSIEKYVDDAADLTKKLLGFARVGKYEITSADLNDLVKKSSKIFGRTKKEIKIHTTYQKDIWVVEIDQNQIEQVLMNFYVNAWQAMPGGGDLTIQTKNLLLDEDYANTYRVDPGRYVMVSVADTGVGMDEETREKIFDPFFTTKEVGKGTGLGLASAYGIVKNHKGFINVYSEKGKGTTFNIYLPASEKRAAKEKELPEELLKGKETVLLVDDEEMILDVGRQLLEKLGYKVLSAGNGKQAIEIYKKNKDNIQIVILDMIMPDMGGGETYDRLKEIDPEIKVLLSSGYSINGQATEILNRGCNGFIQKPFKIRDLSHKVRGILYPSHNNLLTESHRKLKS
jgi:two-component system cell cycle sensor histidine kinase/response regulator CckA